jgi:hypothetical protein
MVLSGQVARSAQTLPQIRGGVEGDVTRKGKLLVLWLLAAVIAAIVFTHFAGQLAFVIENLFALVSPMLRL